MSNLQLLNQRLQQNLDRNTFKPSKGVLKIQQQKLPDLLLIVFLYAKKDQNFINDCRGGAFGLCKQIQ
jgi:hypothetical protein